MPINKMWNKAGRTSGSPKFGDMVYQSPAMHRVRLMIEQTLQSNITVLIHGETGTGKEVVARTIHNNSIRKHKGLFCQNSGALPDSLLESELFGHKRGSFSGAVSDKIGLFEEANGATVFLDEIGEASQALQVRLLRLLETGSFRRVGDITERKTNVRIIAATNRDLEAEVKAGRFREDLYYRLCVFPIHIPPLRERRDDIAVLADHFAREFCAQNSKPYAPLSREIVAALAGRRWSGNVRELKNTVQWMLVSSSFAVDAAALPPRELHPFRREAATTGKPVPGGNIKTLEEVERDYIKHVLDLVNGNKTKAAHHLGLNRSTLRFRLKKLGLSYA